MNNTNLESLEFGGFLTNNKITTVQKAKVLTIQKVSAYVKSLVIFLRELIIFYIRWLCSINKFFVKNKTRNA